MTARRLPLTRGDCVGGPRPCPHACRYRLDGAESCALDVADRGGVSHEEIGAILGVSRASVGRIEAGAVRKLCARLGVPVPPVAEYLPTEALDIVHPSTVRGRVNEARALQALIRAGSTDAAHVAAAIGRSHKVAYAVLRRLVDDGRVTRKRTPGRDGFYVYTLVRGEAAE